MRECRISRQGDSFRRPACHFVRPTATPDSADGHSRARRSGDALCSPGKHTVTLPLTSMKRGKARRLVLVWCLAFSPAPPIRDFRRRLNGQPSETDDKNRRRTDSLFIRMARQLFREDLRSLIWLLVPLFALIPLILKLCRRTAQAAFR